MSCFGQTQLGQKKTTRVNPIPTSTGQNQPINENHVTTASRNRVKALGIWTFTIVRAAHN